MTDIIDVLPVTSELTPFSLEEALDHAFGPSLDESLSYTEDRFEHGTFTVYYSAVEDDTCKVEMASVAGCDFCMANRVFYSTLKSNDMIWSGFRNLR